MPRKRFPYIRILLCLSVIIGAALFLAGTLSHPATPADALRRAMEAFQAGALKKASAELEKAEAEPRIRHWVRLYQGRLWRSQKQYERAVESFKSVPRNSAAWPDALQELLELRGYCKELPLGQELARIMTLAPKIGRKDLLPRLYLSQAAEALSSDRVDIAQAAYRHVRSRHPKTQYSEIAGSQLQNLRNSKRLRKQMSPAELAAEAGVLLKNGRYEDALKTLFQARSALDKQSPAYSETLLLEEKILRKQKRPQEADHVLAQAAASPHSNIAAAALLRMAKSAWNLNDHQKALDLVEKIRQGHAKSSSVGSASYVEARVLEEMMLIPEAKETYRWTVENSEDPLLKLQALFRLGLVHMRFKSYIQAARTFHEARVYARSVLDEQNAGNDPSTSARQLKPRPRDEASRRSLLAHFFSAMYWEAKTLSLLSSEEQEELKFTVEPPNSLFQMLTDLDAAGYYGWRAVQQLRSSQDNSSSHTNDAAMECVLPVDSSLTKLSFFLKKARLEHVAQMEIDWHFGLTSTQTDADKNNGNGLISAAATERITAWVHFSTAFGLPRRGIDIAESYLRSKGPNKLTSCSAALVQLSHPMIHRKVIEKYADEFRVPLPLVYAVARTESRFDPRAVSHVGASGVMQLMPKTATQLGHQDGDDIFDIDQNIRLGTKHLKDLLKGYRGNTIFAAAAYNAGHSPVDLWKKRLNEIEPELWIELIGYPETKGYVKKVLAAQHYYARRMSLYNSQP